MKLRDVPRKDRKELNRIVRQQRKDLKPPMTDDDRMFYIALFLAVFLTFCLSILLSWEN